MSSYRILLIAAAGSVLLLAQKAPDPARDQRPANQNGQTTSRNSSSLSPQDKDFIERAYRDGRDEIALGKLAEQKATNRGVKTFAQKLVTDHTKANKDLEALASRKGVSLYTEQQSSNTQSTSDRSSTTSNRNRNETSSTSSSTSSSSSTRTGGQSANSSASSSESDAERKLAGLSGAEFDRAWVRQMVDDHQKAIDMFEKEAKDTMDPDLRNFVNMALPTLRMHLDQAKNLEKSVG